MSNQKPLEVAPLDKIEEQLRLFYKFRVSIPGRVILLAKKFHKLFKGAEYLVRVTFELLRNFEFGELKEIFQNLLQLKYPTQPRLGVFWYKDYKKIEEVERYKEREIESFYKNNDVGTIDIVIPVYTNEKSFKFLEPLLEGIYKNTEIDFRLIISDDCSPNQKGIELLRKYAKKHSNILLLENNANLGFVKNANIGMAQTKNHFVILNTDVEVPKGWLKRLMYPILAGDNVGTTTPASNNASIFTFPLLEELLVGVEHKLFNGKSLAEIDERFESLNAIPIEVPTGMGYCMGVNKDAFKRVGNFDEKNFGRGFGEENDWCQRAKKAGYKNLFVTNLYLWHKHGGSFDSGEKLKQILASNKTLGKKYPRYHNEIRKHSLNDPANPIRLKLLKEFWGNEAATLMFTHNLGGGTEVYINQELETLKPKQAIVCGYNQKYDFYFAKLYFENSKVQINMQTLEELFEFLEDFKFDEIFVESLISYPDVYGVLEAILELKKQNSAELSLKVHDYFMVSPTVNLVCDFGSPVDPKSQTKFAQLRKSTKQLWPKFIKGQEIDVSEWMRRWEQFLENTEHVICFSNASTKVLSTHYPKLSTSKILVRPHTPPPLAEVSFQTDPNRLVIGVLGGISTIKGINKVRELLRQIDVYNKTASKKVYLVILGGVSELLSSPWLYIYYKYQRSSLPFLMAVFKINCVFVPSVWEETFSYTTREVIDMNLPLVTYDLGGQGEQARNYEKGLVLDLEDGDELKKIIEFVKTIS